MHACINQSIIHMQQQQQAPGCVGCNLQASILSYILVTHCLAEVVQMSFQIPHSSALSHIYYCCHVAATSLSLSLTHTPTPTYTKVCKQASPLGWALVSSCSCNFIWWGPVQYCSRGRSSCNSLVHCSSCLAWWSSFQIDFSPKQQQQQQLLKQCPNFFSNIIIIIIIIIIPSIRVFFAPFDFGTVCDHVWEAHLSMVVRVWESAALNGAHWNHA